ncbi:MAG: hypothetical protein QOG50_2331 [Actinomycetota bacterium]|nr:hypothetical protein [Actinomycetota bacterium]
MRAVVGALDPDAVFVFDAPAMFEAFDVLVRLGESAKTLLARQMEAACTWQRAGYRSAAEQIAAVSGSSVSAARNLLETSKQVEALPATADAMRAGKLSAAKAQAIASAAAVAPDAEAELLAGADAPLAAVRDKCLQAKAVDRDAAYARIRRERRAREFTDKEGAWNFIARGTPDDGAKFRAALDPIVDEMFKTARAEDRKEPRDAYAFDAFIELANRASGTGDREGDGDGDGETRKAKKAAPRFMALIRADIESLLRGTVEGSEICEIAGLGPIPAMVARELLGDAILKLVITKGVDVANVTHLGRSPTVAQQVALWWQAPMCTAEGCTRTRRLENDHQLGWAETHRTRVDELDPLCTHEHDLKTNHGWALVTGTGKRPFVPPTDPRHPKYRKPPDP